MDISLWIALLPGIALLVYVYKKDKLEKEPIKLLLKLLLFGALSCIPAVILEEYAGELLVSAFPDGGVLYLVLNNILGVALIEEGLKFYFLKIATWKNSAFDYRFDGVVYAVYASLGFAILENLLYVMEGGIIVAILRAITAVPAHAMFAIFMGHYYGESRMAYVREDTSGYRKFTAKALIVPILIHGIYDFNCELLNEGYWVIFWGCLIVLYVFAFRQIKRSAKNDALLEEVQNNQIWG